MAWIIRLLVENEKLKNIKNMSQSKYSKETEMEARAWIEALVPEVAPLADDFHEALKDGTVLVKLINAISPGAIKRVGPGKGPFPSMERITTFIKAAREYGVPEADLFVTVDLWEGRDMRQVLQGLESLGRTAQAAGAAGPSFGVKLATKSKLNISEANRLRAAAVPTMRTDTGTSFEREVTLKGRINKIV